MEATIKKIVCPVDFSQPADQALETAVSLAKTNMCELLVLTVVQPLPTVLGEGTLMPELQPTPFLLTETAHDYLAELRNKYCAEIKDRTTLHVATGVPFVEIVRFARVNEADLIVMGSHGRTGLEHLLIGSVAERVVRKASCSVLVVRAANRKFVMP